MIENLRYRENLQGLLEKTLMGEPLNVELIQSSLSSFPNQQTKADQGLERKTYTQHQNLTFWQEVVSVAR